MDEGESAAEAAVRELKEETGYVGQARGDEGVVMFNGSFQTYFSFLFPSQALFSFQEFAPRRALNPTHMFYYLQEATMHTYLIHLPPPPLSPPPLYLYITIIILPDPGFCNTNLRMVTVDVDMSLPENQAPKPQLEENEFIDVFTVPLGELYATCQRLEKEGYAIDARVGTLAEGLEVARRVGL